MHIPVLFGSILIFVLWLQYEIKKNHKLIHKDSDNFWHVERKANLTRPADISTLNYIKIPTHKLPLFHYDHSEINSCCDIIVMLSQKNILNLTGLTNTYLKQRYGSANLKLLIEYDENYTVLVTTLHKLGSLYHSHGYLRAATDILEFAVDCSTDIRNTYTLLARLYQMQHQQSKIDSLIDHIPQTLGNRRNSLIHALVSMRDT